jgi:Putative Flp pilus-assembly TadE/G-like
MRFLNVNARWSLRPDLFRPSPGAPPSKGHPASLRRGVGPRRGHLSPPRKQSGQAIVLIAIMLAVVVGMAALAIDGSRAYALRRDLQAAVDSAALAAGDNLQQTGSYIFAEQAATASFGTNIRIYNAPSCFPGYGAPTATQNPRTITCTYADGTVLTQVVTALGPAGSQFTITASRTLALAFARILTNGTTPRLSAPASAGVNNLLYTPTIAALSQAGCGGMPGNAITTTTGATLNVVGDMVSSGAIFLDGSAQVTGDVYARCQSSVPGLTTMCYPSGNATPCTFPDIAGQTKSGYNFVDPNYPQPVVTGGSMGGPGDFAVLSSGTYAADPAFNFSGTDGRCYFLAGGVYLWQRGYSNYGDFVSNELKPPDEPTYNNHTTVAPHSMWNTDGFNCAGAFQVSGISGSPIITREGTWAIVLTSVRTDSYNGVSYTRESAPSYCHTVFVGDSQVLQIEVSNVPGATSYNVYAAPPNNGCSGQFGLVGNISVVGTPQNNSTTSTCPSYSSTPNCSLGHETALFSGLLLAGNPSSTAAPGTPNAYPPAGETAPLRSNLPNENANRAAPPAGDRANENGCQTVARALTTCPGPITPGAVAFVIPSGGCLNNTQSGDNVIFSGYQYNWMALYEPGAFNPPANQCSNLMGAATDSAFIGLVYTPMAAITVNKASAFRTDEGGGVIAYTLTFGGQLPTIIGDAADYGPVPPGARLTG